MRFKHSKKNKARLLSSFGKIKEEDFDFELIAKYFRSKNNEQAFQVLSDKTCADLDIEEVFMFLDRTHSKVGQQYLYNKLRVIPKSAETLGLHERIIAKLINEEDFRVNVQNELERLKKDDVYHIVSLFQEEHIKPPSWFYVIKLLCFSMFCFLLMLPFRTPLIIPVLFVFLINVAIHYWNKKNLHRYLGSIPQLLRMKNVADSLYKNEALRHLSPLLPSSIKILNQIKNRMSFFQMEAKVQGDIEALLWFLLEVIKTIFLLEPLLLFGALKRLETKRKEIDDVFSFVGEVDSLVSVASLRSGLVSYCVPKIDEQGKVLSVENIAHPLIVNCITNSIKVSDKSILLTGSNMSGKTSFIRAIGINVITGLSLNTCFADKMLLPRLKVYSAIRISDDLVNDKSYYFEEVLTIKDMLSQSNRGGKNLFLLDEIFKGTNTIERIAAGKAVLSELKKGNDIIFVSTHDIELTDLLREEYELYHFSEIVDDNKVDFDYLLKVGKLKNRNAIRILQINGYPDRLIEEAVCISKQLDQNKILSQPSAVNQPLDY
jgi:hypothetical protein